MNKIHLSAILMALTFLIVSCVETNDQLTTKSQSYLEHRTLLTKAATDALSAGVTAEDVENYLTCRMSVPASEIKDISRYEIEDDAAVFVANLNRGGWFLCSGDYSSVPVIAYSERGNFNLNGKLSRHMQGWLQTIREQIVSNRNSYSETVQANRNEWVRTKRASLNRDGDDPDSSDFEIIVDSEWLRDDYYPALTETSWDPAYPFNQAMPKRYNTTLRCIAGCTVVALAQLVYYTHNEFGFPNDIFSSAYCDNYYDEGPPYNFNLSGQTTSTWDDMSLSYNYYNYDPTGWSYVSALFALTADRLNTAYDPDGGETLPSNIPSAMAAFLLSGVVNQSFYKPDVMDEIEADRPAMCSGTSSQGETIGHTFLIDGYLWQIIRETEYIYDLQGHLLEQNETTHDTFWWHINSGEHPQHSFWTSPEYYFPYNRIMHIGWSQY